LSLDNLLQASFEVHRDNSGLAEEVFFSAGALSITLQDGADQPILEPGVGETPLWDKCIVKALFAAEVDTDSLFALIEKSLPQASDIIWELVEDKDWSQEWKKHFKPIACSGGRLWICPSWATPPNEDAINLHLDPGLAFGTGSHPTTMLCLNWLEAQPLAGKTLIDYGCGSGILGIAALLLGASHVVAVDNDPQALLATQDNAQRNGIDNQRLSLYLPEDVPKTIQAHVLVANILANPLIDLAQKISALTQLDGKLCLSGILAHQIDQVTQAYMPKFKFETAKSVDNWIQLSGHKIH
jgi:ribosomal protein L11 methyltransferase